MTMMMMMVTMMMMMAKMLVLQQESNDFAFFVYIKALSKNMKTLLLQQVFIGFGWKVYPGRIRRMAENMFCNRNLLILHFLHI